MKGSEFVAFYAPKGLAAWEAAAFEAARSGGAVQWPWVEVPTTIDGHTAVLRVSSDVFSVGTPEDFVRMPLLPRTAQAIANLQGALLPTPLLTYRIWQAAQVKLPPTAMVPNRGANLVQYAEHNQAIESLRAGREGLAAGHKKTIVVSNAYKPGKVLIFGWYRPSPDVFDNGLPMGDPARQPLQPHSNVHGDFYTDYSHGVRFVHPEALVDGKPMATVDLYQHPTLWKLVSHDGPVRTPRYPAPNEPAPHRPASLASFPTNTYVAPTQSSYADVGLGKVINDYHLKRST